METKRIRFTEGVNRLHGAGMQAPYDLTNAELRKVQGVRALSAPTAPSTGVPSLSVGQAGVFRPTGWQREVVRHGEVWRDQIRAAAQEGTVLYASAGGTYSPALQKHERGDPDPTSPIPQITEVQTQEGQFPTSDSVHAEASDPSRFVYYLLVPINADREAGPHMYAGAEVKNGDNLPELLVTTNEHVQSIDVYRTALFRDDTGGTPERGATAFYRVGFRSANRSGVSKTSTTKTYYTTVPPSDVAGPTSDGSNYYNATGIDYIYLSTSQWTLTESPDFVTYPTDPSAWQVEFQYLANGTERTTGAVGGLQTGVRYYVASQDTDANGNPRVHLQDADGNALSFNGSDVTRFESTFVAGSLAELVSRGVKVKWYPPSESVTEDDTVIIRDDKNWIFDTDEEGNQPSLPTGDPIDRPQNVHTPTDVGVSVDGNGRTNTTQSGLTTASYDDLYYSAGLLYGAAPRWPLDRPQATFLRTGSSNGRGVRAQFEYSLGGNTYYGPPLEIAECTKLAIPWQGVEEALHLFVAQTVTYDVVNIIDSGSGTANVYIDDPSGNFVYVRETYESSDNDNTRSGSYNFDTITFVNPNDGTTYAPQYEGAQHNPTYNGTSHPNETEIQVSSAVQGVEPEDNLTTAYQTEQRGFVQYRRITPSTVGGAYLYDGSSVIFDASELQEGDLISTLQARESTDYLKERDAVFFSATERPMEVTFDQFRAPEGSVVRGVFRSRLEEEEGIRAYDFYVGTKSAIYVGNPSVEDRSVSLQAVASSLGVALTPTNTPAYTLLPGGALIIGTDDRIHSLSGRQEDRLFPDGVVPWTSLRDLVYSPGSEVVYASTPEGVWGYDTDRQAITLQYDLDATSLAWDPSRGAVICYDQEDSAWKVLDEGGAPLTAAVQTQPLGHGGEEYDVRRAKVDYDTAAYDPTNSMTHATLEQTRRHGSTVYNSRVPRNYWTTPPLRGEGLQFRAERFSTLREILIEVSAA